MVAIETLSVRMSERVPANSAATLAERAEMRRCAKDTAANSGKIGKVAAPAEARDFALGASLVHENGFWNVYVRFDATKVPLVSIFCKFLVTRLCSLLFRARRSTLHHHLTSLDGHVTYKVMFCAADSWMPRDTGLSAYAHTLRGAGKSTGELERALITRLAAQLRPARDPSHCAPTARQRTYVDLQTAECGCTEFLMWIAAVAAKSLRCRLCGAPGEARCSLCETTAYCGAACQHEDWRAHKCVCAHLARARAFALDAGAGADADTNMDADADADAGAGAAADAIHALFSDEARRHIIAETASVLVESGDEGDVTLSSNSCSDSE
jgi:hypothetical protein